MTCLVQIVHKHVCGCDCTRVHYDMNPPLPNLLMRISRVTDIAVKTADKRTEQQHYKYSVCVDRFVYHRIYLHSSHLVDIYRYAKCCTNK